MAYWSQKDDLHFVPLTEAQEKDLFKKFYAGDIAARDSIIQHHLKHVTKLSLRFAKQAFPDDLAVSAGIDGLMQALEGRKFRPNSGFRFASYVRPFIRGKVFRAMANHHTIPVPQPPTYSHRADGSAVTGQLCDDAHSTGAVNEGRNQFFSMEQIPAPEEFAEHEAERNDLAAHRRKVIEAALKRLRPRDARVVRKVALEGMTLEEVSAEQGFSRQNAGPAYLRGIARLRQLLANKREELGV